MFNGLANQQIKTVVQLIQSFLEQNLYSKEQLIEFGFEECDIDAAIEWSSKRPKENLIDVNSPSIVSEPERLHLVLSLKGVQADVLKKHEKEQEQIKTVCDDTLELNSSEQFNHPLHFSQNLHLVLRLRAEQSTKVEPIDSEESVGDSVSEKLQDVQAKIAALQEQDLSELSSRNPLQDVTGSKSLHLVLRLRGGKSTDTELAAEPQGNSFKNSY